MDPAHQAAQKSPLIDAVGGLVQCVGAGGQIDGRADRGDGGKRRPRRVPHSPASLSTRLPPME